MIYTAVTFGSLVAVFIHYFYIKKKQLRFSKPWFLLELPVFWILEFCIFYLKSFNDYGYWPGENKAIPTIVTGVSAGVVLAVLAALIYTFIFQKRTDKYKTKCLFTVKGIQLFPFNSFIYALTGLLITVAGMFVIEIAVDSGKDLERWNADYITTNNMNFEKLKTDLKYPLVKIRGTALKKYANVKILVLGDSFVFGFGSSNLNYLWWNQLSGELTRRGYNCTVYAVGQGGASTYNELKWLTTTTMISDLKPDIVIIGYVTNDPEYDPSSGGNFNYSGNYYGTFSQVLDIPYKKIFQKFLPTVFASIDYSVTLKFSQFEIVRKKIGYQIADWEQKIVEGKMLSDYNSYIIKPLGKFAASIDIPIILVTTPQTPNIAYFEPKYTPVLPLFEKAGIKTYNMLYDFYNKCSGEKYANNYAINPTDSHPGTTDTWFYSKYIADKLELDYPQILGKKTLTGKEVYNIEVNDWMPYSLSPRTVIESETSAQYVISYPAQNSPESFLTMPAKETYVKMNFKYPVDISTVSIAGKKLDSATLYFTGINEDLGFDDQIMHNLGKKSGRTCEWPNSGGLRVTSLCVHAEIPDGTGGNLTVTVTCKKGGTHP